MELLPDCRGDQFDFAFSMKDPVTKRVCIIATKGDRCGFVFYQDPEDVIDECGAKIHFRVTGAEPGPDFKLDYSLAMLKEEFGIPKHCESQMQAMSMLTARMLMRNRARWIH